MKIPVDYFKRITYTVTVNVTGEQKEKECRCFWCIRL